MNAMRLVWFRVLMSATDDALDSIENAQATTWLENVNGDMQVYLENSEKIKKNVYCS